MPRSAISPDWPEFRALESDADRYIALLAWVARNYAAEFTDFVEHLESGRRYAGMTPAEIRQARGQHRARQIPGTHFWAILDLGAEARRRFLRRLLVFVGLPDEAIAQAAAVPGL